MTTQPVGHRPCLLVVEDNPADVDLLRLALEESGVDCELVVERDGGDALARVRRQDLAAPNLAVIDLNLPKNDGLEVLAALRENPALRGVPVLVLSSSPSPRDVARVRAFPLTRYQMKPIILDQYVEIGRLIARLLEEGRSGGAVAG